MKKNTHTRAMNGRLYGCALSAIAFVAMAAGQAGAQAVEHNAPSVPSGSNVLVAPPNLPSASQDNTPLGGSLRAVVILNTTDELKSHVDSGIDLGTGTRLSGDNAIQKDLSRYLGKPMSRKLIADLEATIARHYRAAGYPFVSLSTPEQEISGGVLQVRVIEFQAGDITVRGAKSEGVASDIQKNVRQQSGAPINAPELNQDLTWLNRYPFHQVQAVFTPGKALGVSDLALVVNDVKPWQVYAGVNNYGSPATGTTRFLVGGTIGNLLGRNSLLSYQATSSSEIGKSNSPYFSNALNYSLPVGKRGQIEASFDDVRSYQTLDPFAVRTVDTGLTAGYRFGLASSKDMGLTDVRLGVETRREKGKTYFNGVGVFDATMNIYQLYAGLHHTSPGQRNRGFDVAVHYSPGNVDTDNSSANLLSYSQGRVKSASYSYLTASYDGAWALSDTVLFKTAIMGQVASAPLPRTEQAGLGGAYLVRGYSLDDGAFDTAMVMRNELRIAPGAYGTGSVNPYLFLDLGQGRDQFTKANRGIASTGAGLNVQMTQHVSANLDVACALRNGLSTRTGNWNLHAGLSVGF